MLNATFVPVVAWPGVATPTYKRQDARFKSAYAKTLDLLEAELRHLGGKNLLIQAGFSRSDIRNDGWPKSNARKPSSPGVIVTFETRAGATLSFPCDRYKNWEDNLRAIALSMEALRAVDRYGVTQGTEQYRGFEALPAPKPKMDEHQAAAVLAEHGRLGSPLSILSGPVSFKDSLRAAQLATHPDKKGGDSTKFLEVQEAGKVLEAFYAGGGQ